MTHRLDAVAQLAFSIALVDDRCGEMLEHLFNGGGLTVDPVDRQLILIPADVIAQFGGGAEL